MTAVQSSTPTPKRALSRHYLLTGLCGVVVAGLLGWHMLGLSATPDNKARNHNAITVGVGQATRQDVPLSLTALGTVTAANTATVHSRVDGLLVKINFREGEQVKAGQVLAELDPRPFMATVAQQEGQLQRDQALLRNAQRDLDRYQKLLPAVSRQQVESQQALVEQYQGTVRLDQGQLDSARLQLEYSRITAPISGTVGLRQVDVGNLVKSTDTTGLAVITQTSPIHVVFAIPESSLGNVIAALPSSAGSNQAALAVEARDRDDRHLLAQGKLLAIDNQINSTTGTVNLKAEFDNRTAQLFPNQFVNVHLALGQRHDALVIPTEAIQLGQPGHYVYAVQADNTVRMTPVKIGPAANGKTIIEAGLQPGEQVVTQGVDKLRNGSAIRIGQLPGAAVDQTADLHSGKGSHRHQPAGATASTSAAVQSE